MISAGVFLMVVMIMVTAADIGIIGQRTGKVCFHRLIRAAADTAKELDSRCRQRHLGAKSLLLQIPRNVLVMIIQADLTDGLDLFIEFT